MNHANAVTHTRILAAPRDLVFRCLLEPAHLTHFWGPIGMSTPLEGILADPRPGGAFETTMVADAGGGRYTMRAVYEEITEPVSISWTETESGMRSVATFVDLGDGRTQLTIEQSRVPAPALTPAAQAGFRTSLDRFEAHLRSLLETRPA